MPAILYASTVGDLRAFLFSVPDSTPLVQINPVNVEGPLQICVNDDETTLRVEVYEG